MQVGAVEQGGVWLVRCAAARGFWRWTGSWGDVKTCRQRMSSLSSKPRDSGQSLGCTRTSRCTKVALLCCTLCLAAKLWRIFSRGMDVGTCTLIRLPVVSTMLNLRMLPPARFPTVPTRQRDATPCGSGVLRPEENADSDAPESEGDARGPSEAEGREAVDDESASSTWHSVTV